MKRCEQSAKARQVIALEIPLAGFLLLIFTAGLAAAGQQADADVSPEAAPEIRQVKPGQAEAGNEVTVIVEGKNFSAGAYVSFSNPGVHAISTKRVSATQLEARVAIGKKADSGAVSLYVSNPASTVAEAPFTITGGAAPAEVPAPAPPAAPPAQATSLVPTAAAAEPAALVPEVTSIDPPRAGKGSQFDLKIRGRNFAKGAKIAFSNPGIRVFETRVTKDAELTARIRIADDAATGSTGLFVINPDDNETEAAFVVTDDTPTNTASTSTPAKPTAESAPTAKTDEKDASDFTQFDVISLADVAAIFQKGNRPQGTLKLFANKLRYEESGKEVFAFATSDIKEVAPNTFLGVNTGTFHIILNSGQSYNFIAASLRPADSQTILDSLRKAVK